MFWNSLGSKSTCAQREDGGIIYSSKPLACSISATEAPNSPHVHIWFGSACNGHHAPWWLFSHDCDDELFQVLENGGSLQTVYARFPLLCTPSRTLQLPVEACSFVILQSKNDDCIASHEHIWLEYEPPPQLRFPQAEVHVVDDTFNSKGENVTDGQASIGYALAEAPALRAMFLSCSRVIWCYMPCEIMMSVPVRLWVSCTKPSLTSGRKRGGLLSFRCLLAETGTGMRFLGKGLLVVDEDSQLQPFIFSYA